MAEQVEKYESSCTPPRTFLIQLLLGADTVLARVLDEMTATRLLTPISLGEILKNRAYASTSLVNKLAAKNLMNGRWVWTRVGDTAELVPTESKFGPSSGWAIVDAMEGIRWAYVWAGFSDDEVAARFANARMISRG